MNELCNKYPALCIPIEFVKTVKHLLIMRTIENMEKDFLYQDFKANISCIGLEPSEYEQVIKWFCDTMEY